MNTLVIDPIAEVPLFEQLRRQLVDQISSDRFPADTKLPAIRRVATDLVVAPGTVARAYKELLTEGYLMSRGPSGTAVAPNASSDPRTHAQRLSVDYVASIQAFGFSAQDILHHLRSAIPGQ